MIKMFSLILAMLACGLITFSITNTPDLRKRGGFVAYRGGGQLVDYHKLKEGGCTAKAIIHSKNVHIENTEESIKEASDAGFNVIHINVQRSVDNEFVVFHDWTLDCATSGAGEVIASTANVLAELDAGYSFSFDGGGHFPFRGKGYRISSLISILDKFPDRPFWLNLKNNDEASFARLYELLRLRYADRLPEFVIIASEKGENWFRQKAVGVTVISVESTKKCIKEYVLYGWSGVFPDACSNRPILLPPDKTRYIWGYPKRFAARAQANDGDVYLWTEHTPLSSHQLEIENGIGVVTGDIEGFKSALH